MSQCRHSDLWIVSVSRVKVSVVRFYKIPQSAVTSRADFFASFLSIGFRGRLWELGLADLFGQEMALVLFLSPSHPIALPGPKFSVAGTSGPLISIPFHSGSSGGVCSAVPRAVPDLSGRLALPLGPGLCVPSAPTPELPDLFASRGRHTVSWALSFIS